MKQHTYIIPYYESNNKIYILLAKKKFFSNKDGFIHSNANQLVLIGGHLDKKNKNDIVANIEKEFLEETGYKVNKNKIQLLEQCKKTDPVCYFVGIYKCNNIEYNNFSDFNNLTKDQKYVELNDLIWVELNGAKNLMHTHNSSLNVKYMTYQYVNQFIENAKSQKWYSLNELKHIYNKYKRNDMSKKEVARKILFPKILKGDKNLIYKIQNEVERYIRKNSYYDWFLESIELFEKHINSNSKNIVKLKSPSKKSPLKKLSPKDNRKPKRKYIPPHLRNKN